jgi:hypothetical protein
MAALSNIKITYQKGKGYKKFIGGRRWWLGHDEKLARFLAMGIMRRWEVIKANGGDEWSEEDISEIYRQKNGDRTIPEVNPAMRYRPYARPVFHTGAAPKPTQAVSVTPKPVTTAKGPTLGDLLTEFSNHINTDPQRSIAHKSTLTNRLEQIKPSLPLNMPVAEFGADEITQAVRYWAGRPKSKTTKKQISISTAKHGIAAIRQFCYWMDATGKWKPAGRLESLFKIKTKSLMTNAERKQQAGGVQTFTVDDLKKLYGAANEQGKLFLLLGLNCGFAQSEISSLTNWEIKLHTDQPRIERHRRKTEVFGAWPLWDETVKLLKRRMKKTPKNVDELAILTRNGTSLVSYGGDKNQRSDAIGQVWTKLLKKVPDVQQLPFRFLRKTGADMIRKIAGRDTSEAFLAHADTGIAKLYTNADFEKVAQAVMRLRTELDSIF